MYTSVAETIDVDELVDKYGTLVKRIAHYLLARLPAGVQLDDLLQSGIVGLIEAARNYDAAKGASFETFAGIRVRGAMIDEVRKGDWSPRSVHRNSRRIAQAIRELENQSRAEVSDQGIAKHLGVSLQEYHAMLQDTVASRLFSLDELVGHEEGADARYGVTVDSPELEAARDGLTQDVASAIENLPERERLVLSLYYDDELNLKEIGQVIEVSESRVSQILSQAIKRLRARLAPAYDIGQ